MQQPDTATVPVRIDEDTQELVFVHLPGTEQRVRLYKKALVLFRYLLEHLDRVKTRAEIRSAHFAETNEGSNAIDVQIRYIREALEQVTECPIYIETHRGVGYALRLKVFEQEV